MHSWRDVELSAGVLGCWMLIPEVVAGMVAGSVEAPELLRGVVALSVLSPRGCPSARLGALACVCCLAPALSRNAEHAAAPAWSQGLASSPPERGERKTWLQAQPAVRRAIWAETRGAGLRQQLRPFSVPQQAAAGSCHGCC